MSFRPGIYILAAYLLSTVAEAKVLTSVADIVDRALPGVVNIRTVTFKNSNNSLNLYQFFLQGSVPKSESTQALGSGVIIDSSGHIITNYHVIKDSTTIEVLLGKERVIKQAKVLGADPKTDLALLKVNGQQKYYPASLGDSDKLRVGDLVVAIGNPFGYSHTVTSGIISAKGRVIGTGPYDNFLQTDAPIHPGNSGGPLIDMRGRVIGINTAISGKGQGIGFAIPVNLVKVIVEDLKKHGKVIRPWLGVIGKNRLTQHEINFRPGTHGVYGVIVENLVVDSPAYKAGIRIGDLLIGIGDKKIEDMNYLQRALLNYKPSDQVLMKIYRRSKGNLHINVQLDSMPKTKDLPVDKDLF